MPKYYGFECKLCATVVAIGTLEPNNEKNITFYAAPLVPVICPDCGGSYQCDMDDLFGFEVEENIEQFPAKTIASKPKP
ncbi:MAG TPA: hypothetical protein VEI26_07635 [Terriglobales bacterium]|nr:hypothetical protein [Terriglobales bacterium]